MDSAVPLMSFEKAIKNRRSERSYSEVPMSLPELSQLLRYSIGVTEEHHNLRAAPSAGALYPIEVYPVVNSVEGLDSGVYHYNVSEDALELVKEGDFRRALTRHALGQSMMGKAQVVLAMAALFERTERRYGDRARQYIFLEAGHIGQNIYLVATAMGLGVCAVGAYSDEGYNQLIGVDGRKEGTVYLLTAGTLRSG